MRLLRFALPAVALAASFAVSFAQQEPPAPAEPAPTPSAPPPAPAPEEEEPDPDAPEGAPGDDVDDVFIPTEELQPDAAVTFPVDI